MKAELSRPLLLDRLGDAGRVEVEADTAERDAVASRLGIGGVLRLHCVFDLRRAEGGTILATGTLNARVIQECVVSAENFESEVAEDFAVRFVPEGMESDELDLDAPDDIPYAHGVIDLGEAAAEQLALALPAFPKKPDADFAEETRDGKPSPFEVLRRLKGDG